jgi:hypothetical protein
MPGSAMAAALAAQEATRRQRRMDAEIERRRVMRRAQRRLMQADHADHVGEAPERHRFPCAAVCLRCGFLLPPAVAKGDPMRSDAGAVALPAEYCGGCGAKTWADLAVPSTAEALRDHERREIELRSGIVPAGLGMLASGCVATIALVGAMVAEIEFITMAAIFAIASAFVMFTGRRAIAGLTTPRRGACRWRAPTRRARSGDVLGGGAVAAAHSLCAPITGRAVLGWRVEVRYPRDHGDAFALVEQECAPLLVAGVALGHEPTIVTDAITARADRPEARQYLVSRGIDPDDILEIRERVVQAGAQVTVRADREAGRAVVADR